MHPPEITLAQFLTRLGMAALLGILIGFERQWRQRSAGLHTSSLVAIGAALFALLDTVLGQSDTTRIVAGVVTGVGFIAGGVILKSGATITGLNTAATMWATAAVGALAGFGLWWASSAAAVAIIAVNLVLQPVADAIDVRAKRLRIAQIETPYCLSAVCSDESLPAVSTAVVAAVSRSRLTLQSLTKKRDGSSIEIVAGIVSPTPDDEALERLANALLAIAGVERSHWTNAG